MAGQMNVFGGAQGGYQGVVAPAPESNQTADFIMKMADKYVGNQVAQKQQQMYLAGMQRVATGEALADIKKDDPPMAKIFGPTATIRGAQAMASMTKVDDFTTDVYRQMPELAKMDPSEAGKRIAAGMNQHMTGDPDVDIAVQTKITQQLPTLMKAQAKANYAYVQGESARQFTGMVNAAGNTIQGAALGLANGTTNESDFNNAKFAALSAMHQPAGMDDKTYRDTIKKVAINQMAQGNHYLDRWMNERVNGKPSFYEQVLDVDDQTDIIKARQQAETATAQQYGFNQYGAEIAKLSGQAAGMSPAAIQQQVLSINERYMKETGSSTGILTQKDAMSMQKSSYTRAFRLNDQRNLAEYKEDLRTAADQAKQNATITSAMAMLEGGMGKFTQAAGVKGPEVDAIAWQSFQAKNTQQGADVASKYIVDNYNHGNTYINPQLQSMMQEPFRQLEGGGPIGAEFDRTQQLYTSLVAQPDGQATADAYLGTENAIRMEQYNRFIRTGSLTKQEAQQAVWGKPIVNNPSVNSAANNGELDKALDELSKKGGASSWLRGIPGMDDTNKAILRTAAAKDMQLYMDNLGMSAAEAAKRAAPAVLQKVDILGPAVIHKMPGQDSLSQAIGSNQEDAGRAMFNTAQAKAREQGVNVDLGGWFETLNNSVKDPSKYSITADMMGQRTGLGTGATTFSGKFSPWQAMTTHGDLRINRLRDQTIDGHTVQIYHATVTTPSGDSANFSFDSRDVRKNLEATIKPNK
ncbi:internal virion protein [Pseudomonas phage Eisa9]|uniref:Internal virion protein n=1 Tax=Pseudomonas phage Eisa9 TaxID=2900148 RepID=A0AAE9C8M4_9CAUD|nr:internal virion protein [Pseudomonas phage Eisa9]